MEGAVQVWYADDSGAGGKIEGLRSWWNGLNEKGSYFGYDPNSAKVHPAG